MEGVRFSLLVEMLDRAFRGGNSVSQDNYHDMVWCLRTYDTSGRARQNEERKVLLRHGWPTSYHPCDHMERIRWGMCFGDVSDDIIDARVQAFADTYGEEGGPSLVPPSRRAQAATPPTVYDVFSGTCTSQASVTAALCAYRNAL